MKQGRYLLGVESVDVESGLYVVDVLSSGVKVYQLEPSGLHLLPVDYPLTIPTKPRFYYEVYEQWTIASLFKGQMGIFLAVSLFIMFIAKKMPNLEEVME